MIGFLEEGEQKKGLATAIIVLFSVAIILSFVISFTFQVYLLVLRCKKSKARDESKMEYSNIQAVGTDKELQTADAKKESEIDEEVGATPVTGASVKPQKIVLEESNVQPEVDDEASDQI